jgi:protein-tyrosine phosphatase
MAEGVFRTMAHRCGLASAFSVDSAGTFDGYVGQPPARAAIKAAALRGYDIRGLRARQVVPSDIEDGCEGILKALAPLAESAATA